MVAFFGCNRGSACPCMAAVKDCQVKERLTASGAGSETEMTQFGTACAVHHAGCKHVPPASRSRQTLPSGQDQSSHASVMQAGISALLAYCCASQLSEWNSCDSCKLPLHMLCKEVPDQHWPAIVPWVFSLLLAVWISVEHC